jgi:hypothetical protein
MTIGNRMSTFISVGGFEYEDEVEGFIGLFCPKCDQEIGYDPCPDCK